MRKNRTIYRLVVADIQTVAQDEIGRELSETEINAIEDLVAENIPWYDAIANAVREKMNDK